MSQERLASGSRVIAFRKVDFKGSKSGPGALVGTQRLYGFVEVAAHRLSIAGVPERIRQNELKRKEETTCVI
jgi:hypothetical protein